MVDSHKALQQDIQRVRGTGASLDSVQEEMEPIFFLNYGIRVHVMFLKSRVVVSAAESEE